MTQIRRPAKLVIKIFVARSKLIDVNVSKSLW